MALNSINTNVAAYFAQANIGKANTASSTSIGRLSSGNRIVQASDDVAGLAAGTSLQTTVTTLRAALTNASQGTSLLQVADGALAEITDILQRQKSLAVQAGSGSLTDVERGFLDQEFQALTSEIDRLVESTSFNGVNLLGGTALTTQLAQTDAIADFDPTGADNTAVSVASTHSIEAFNISTGATEYNAAPSAANELVFVDSVGTELTNAQLETVNPNVFGALENFRITEINPDISARLTVDINGIEFSGTFGDGDTDVIVNNGNTYIQIGSAAIDVLNSSTAEVAATTLNDAYSDTRIARTNVVSGVDFSGTRLEGVTGDAADEGGIVQVRLYENPNNVRISNFQYISNAGAADTNVITADVNGATFTAVDVVDNVAAGETIVFEDGTGQFFAIALDNLTNDFGQGTNDDIRQDLVQRQAFIDALNIGFGRANAGLEFAIGETSRDSINVAIDNVSTEFLFDGQSLSLASATSAAEASDVIDGALDRLTAVRADVGATQSRFNFASSNVEVAVQNQDAARAVFLDTDVAAESTSFATSQVQLQAGISVLAQANLLAQNLLKLIG